MTYQGRLLAHLARYKHEKLGIQEPGLFRYRGREIPKDHILPLKAAWPNVLPAALAPTQAYLRAHRTVKRHRYFHHLNSSQAFAFNLFIPFYSAGGDAAQCLLRALEDEGTVADWELEAVPDEEEGSNLDARWTGSDGQMTYCEVKLSEAEFGTAPADERHKRKLELYYLPVLAPFVAPDLLRPDRFFGAYQILRNIWHLAWTPKSRLIFLLPRANAPPWAALDRVMKYLDPVLSARVSIVAMEDVLELLISSSECPAPLRRHTEKCREKYVIPN